ncbi:hypothetical protein BDV11DRAFT_173393 [Aspergillus similis]
MPFKALLYLTRKPGHTPVEFKTHYDNKSYPVVALAGSQEDFGYDCITKMTFEDEAAFKKFFGRRMELGTKEILDEDEEKFMDRPNGQFSP